MQLQIQPLHCVQNFPTLASTNQQGALMNIETPTRGRRTSWVLSVVALAPLALLAVLLVFVGRENASFLPFLDAFKTLSAITLSYLGGIRLGMALRGQAISVVGMVGTILPGAIGWLCLFLPDALAISLLLLSVCALGAWDAFALHGTNGPHWFSKIRTVMTMLAALAHVVVLLVIL